MIKLDNIVTVFISQAMIKLEHFDTSRSCVTLCLYIGAVLIAKIDIKFISFISQSKVLLTLLLASQDLIIVNKNTYKVIEGPSKSCYDIFLNLRNNGAVRVLGSSFSVSHYQICPTLKKLRSRSGGFLQAI